MPEGMKNLFFIVALLVSPLAQAEIFDRESSREAKVIEELEGGDIFYFPRGFKFKKMDPSSPNAIAELRLEKTKDGTGGVCVMIIPTEAKIFEIDTYASWRVSKRTASRGGSFTLERLDVSRKITVDCTTPEVSVELFRAYNIGTTFRPDTYKVEKMNLQQEERNEEAQAL